MRQKLSLSRNVLTLGAAAALLFASGCGTKDGGGGSTDEDVDASTSSLADAGGGGGRGGAGGRGGSAGTSSGGASGNLGTGGGGGGGSAGSAGGAGGNGGAGGGKDAGAVDAGAPTDTGSPSDAGTKTDGGVGSAPTFNEIYDLILDATPLVPASGCQGSSCHTGANPKKGVNFKDLMTAYTTLKPYVKSTAATSTFYKVLTRMGVPMDEYMPKDKPKLPDALIEKVKLWIDAGAKAPI